MAGYEKARRQTETIPRKLRSRAGGKRVEAGIVILFTAVLYVVSSKLIAYIPTILASGLVLFLGIELTLEAVLESAKYFVWSEWLVVIATLFSCTFIGFAPGVGVRICTAFVVYTGWGCFDLRAKKIHFAGQRSTLAQQQGYRRFHQGVDPRSLDLATRYSRVPDSTSACEEGTPYEDAVGEEIYIKVVRLNGYVFFGVIPSIESAITNTPSGSSTQQYIIVDMESAYRVETAAARLIKTKARDTFRTTLVACGFDKTSGVAADLKRSGVELSFMHDGLNEPEDSILAFDDCDVAWEWCKLDRAHRAQTDGISYELSQNKVKALAARQFLTLLGEAEHSESSHWDAVSSWPKSDTKVRVFAPKFRIPRPVPGPNTIHLLCVVSGTLKFVCPEEKVIQELPVAHTRPTPARYNRDSLLRTLTGTVRYMTALAVQWTEERVGKGERRQGAISSSSRAPDGSDTDMDNEFSDGKRAVAGDVIYIPSPLSEKTPLPSLVESSASRFKRWHESCPEVVVGDSTSQYTTGDSGSISGDGSDPWIVEIVTSEDSLSSQTIEDACAHALRRTVSLLKADNEKN
ncbi:hypothetical protein N7476_006220 [Penicillium atrosanguineum]|uniref:Uncharacterized protein n=1 Tax=Penicillium atrosanguineum TaxID=1132637 RepID=A0A9W9PYF4_9EURO|nr:hypothetical protein N7476_006220 [Penicillium atrosanguineum]